MGDDVRSDSVVVAVFPQRYEAEMAHGFLDEAGIEAVVVADDGGGALGAPLNFYAGAAAVVGVAREDEAKARAVLVEAGIETVDPEEEEGIPDV